MLSRLLLLQQLAPAAGCAALGGSRSLLLAQQQSRPPPAFSTAPTQEAQETQAQETQLQEQQQPLVQQKQQKQRQAASDAQPVHPVQMILKTLLCADKPLTSHELWNQVHAEYGFSIPTRSQFKVHMKAMQRRRLIQAKAQAKARTGKANDPFVYDVTHIGLAVDLNEGGSRLQLKARTLADAWTEQQLPQYKQHLAAGRVPLTPDNEGLLSADEKQKLVKQWQKKQQQQQQRAPAVSGAWEQQLQTVESKKRQKQQQGRQRRG